MVSTKINLGKPQPLAKRQSLRFRRQSINMLPKAGILVEILGIILSRALIGVEEQAITGKLYG